jgi:hypothetical protein
MRPNLTIALTATLLASCAEPAHRPNSGNASIACCVAISALVPRQLEISKPIRQDIKDTTPKVEVNGSTSPAIAFSLPPGSFERRLILKSHALGIFIGTTDVFCPTVTFIMAGDTLVNLGEELPFRYTRDSSWDYNAFYIVALPIPREAKSVVVHTTQNLLQRRIPHNEYVGGNFVFSGKVPVYVDSRQTQGTYPCINTGSIEVEVK